MNHLFQIKICGITTPTDALMACESGADAIGINFYPASPRFVTPEIAAEICETISKFNLASHRSVATVGVFVNDSNDQILEVVNRCSLTAVQFHGDESPEVVTLLRRKLAEQGIQCQIVRAVRSQSESSDFNKVEREIEAWTAVGCDAVLLDAAAPGQYGGTGKVVDWTMVSDIKCDVPFILAGGLNPSNVADAIRVSGVCAVDTASGVESAPGIKDETKVRAFVDTARDALNP